MTYFYALRAIQFTSTLFYFPHWAHESPPTPKNRRRPNAAWPRPTPAHFFPLFLLIRRNFIIRRTNSSKVPSILSHHRINVHSFCLKLEYEARWMWVGSHQSSSCRKVWERIDDNKFFIHSKTRTFVHTWTHDKKNSQIHVIKRCSVGKGESSGGKIANKFEMENLLIMSTVFSIRFITQKCSFSCQYGTHTAHNSQQQKDARRAWRTEREKKS